MGSSAFQSHFFFYNLQPYGEQVMDKKRDAICIEMLIINSAGELSFMWTCFQHDKINGMNGLKKMYNLRDVS